MSINPPSNRNEWETYAATARTTLWGLLGDMPPLFTPQPKITSREAREGYTLERLEFENGAGATIYGYFLLPDNSDHLLPAVLYNHLHGGKYALGKDELFEAVHDGFVIGPALVKAGYAVLAIDAYGFGQRETQGPAGERERGAAVEQALFKKFVWEGSTLWGMMVRDDLLALNYLTSRPEIDPQRIAATGMSLGGSRTTWLAALDERIKVAVPVAQMTRYTDFGAAGNYNLHGIYYYVPGFLKSGLEMEILTSLAAPRAQMILIGDSDPLSPFEGVQKVIDYTQQIYRLYDAEPQFQPVVYAGVAHKYTPEMFSAMQEWLKETL